MVLPTTSADLLRLAARVVEAPAAFMVLLIAGYGIHEWLGEFFAEDSPARENGYFQEENAGGGLFQ